MGIYSLETSLTVPLKDRPVSNLFVVKMYMLFIATLLTRPLHLNVGSTGVTCLSLDYFVFFTGFSLCSLSCREVLFKRVEPSSPD